MPRIASTRFSAATRIASSDASGSAAAQLPPHRTTSVKATIEGVSSLGWSGASSPNSLSRGSRPADSRRSTNAVATGPDRSLRTMADRGRNVPRMILVRPAESWRFGEQHCRAVEITGKNLRQPELAPRRPRTVLHRLLGSADNGTERRAVGAQLAKQSSQGRRTTPSGFEMPSRVRSSKPPAASAIPSRKSPRHGDLRLHDDDV